MSELKFPGKDFPDRDKWLTIRNTPKRDTSRPIKQPGVGAYLRNVQLNVLRATIHWILRNAQNTRREQ